MHCPSWAFAIFGAFVLLDALAVIHTDESTKALDDTALDAKAVLHLIHNLLDDAANPGQALDLLERDVFSKKKLEKKWNWKEASEESKTEWAIVLKRYVLADMTLYEMDRFFGEALSATATYDEQREVVEKTRVKLARLQSNFEKAVLDQNTSDVTAGDMQKQTKTNQLTVHEKRLLADEHKREQYGFFAMEASGQDVLEKANELFQALDAKKAEPKKVSPSWGSIVSAPAATVTAEPTYVSMLNVTPEVAVTNATSSNTTTALRGSSKPIKDAKSTVEMLYQNFQAASKTFHKDLGSFESSQSKAVTNLLESM